MADFPAICNELRLRSLGDVPLVNSRDVAELFGKRHTNVLRDIDVLVGSDLSRPHWFHPLNYLDVQRKEQRSFDMTRQGFTQLVMGWNGQRARDFQVRYIEAFDAMEAALKSGIGPDEKFILAVREIVAPLAVRFSGQDEAIGRLEKGQGEIKLDVAFIKRHLIHGKPRNITNKTKAEHVDAIRLLGGRCPCCHQSEVLVDGEKSKFAEFDHFYANSLPSPDHTWLICKKCHNDFTYGRVARDQRRAEFDAYQAQRRRLPGRQSNLFGA